MIGLYSSGNGLVCLALIVQLAVTKNVAWHCTVGPLIFFFFFMFLNAFPGTNHFCNYMTPRVAAELVENNQDEVLFKTN